MPSAFSLFTETLGARSPSPAWLPADKGTISLPKGKTSKWQSSLVMKL